MLVLALETLAFCFRPRKKMVPRIWKNSMKAAVTMMGPYLATSSPGQALLLLPSAEEASKGTKPKYLAASSPLGRPQGTWKCGEGG